MLNVEKTMQWLALFTEKVADNQTYLSDLDSAIGDGDHGANMARGTKEMLAALNEKQPETVSDVFKLAAMTMISKVGGASGPLYGSAFMGMAKASATTDELTTILSAGVTEIEKRGKATRGEKTMLDVWIPVVEKLETGELVTSDIAELTEATKPMKATKGRASYLGERSVGHLDPGAVSSGYFFEAMLEAGVRK
ncbi:dihydroxyacetone kinase subunit L [Vagococcus penaei]|uniref:phosphoenolpyruvate--glycerone phosphotransferase n=1 Tax=Vagococcus penaei TaxID=633807 RepID=A0A1Q2D6T6_9ENTE|nr:dihydroxyacetone kinase subunit DhaL [Vagococcus penaei]AQP54128.1 dihydroxyacetone kinase subunit L [Vagococcus penaei]RSU02127.1 dihydroxyacetone kinase subunit L [Vagococcus penaei]